MNQCAIVVATYNRKELLQRTLSCVATADYKGYNDISLIISIDRASNYAEMKEVADSFEWKYGEKHVILHEERQGLRKHFIFCGGLSQKYGPVIFLEDDVVVNKYYYQTAQQMTDYYINDDRIVGVSLYSFAFNETAQRAFIPIHDGGDVYFCSLMSWAPVYFPNQWKKFDEWLQKLNGREVVYENIPKNVHQWRKTSFKKLHIQYMAQNDLYFAYSRYSCATNFSEPGEHYRKSSNILQVPMTIRERGALKLVSLEDSLSVYDTFMELSPEIIKKMVPSLSGYSFDVDLYGKKESVNITKEYVLTSRKTVGYELMFGRKMQPHELNVIWNIQGNEFCLSRKEDVRYGSKGFGRYCSEILYDIKGSNVLKIMISDILWAYSALMARLKRR